MTEVKPKLTLKLNTDRLQAIQKKLAVSIPVAKPIQSVKPVQQPIKQDKMPREEYKEMLDIVRRRFSKAFSKCADPIRILKLGIHTDIASRLKIEEKKVKLFLYVYTKKKKYQLALKVGADRYDLNGIVVGKVTEKEVSVKPKKSTNK